MNKEIVMTFRVTPYERNRIRGLARDYAQGDVSLWIRHAAVNAERKFLTPKRKRTPKNKSRESSSLSKLKKSAR